MSTVSSAFIRDLPPPPAAEPVLADAAELSAQPAESAPTAPVLADLAELQSNGPYAMDPAVLPADMMKALQQGSQALTGEAHPVDFSSLPDSLRDAVDHLKPSPIDLDEIDLDEIESDRIDLDDIDIDGTGGGIDLGDIEIKLPPPEIPFVRGENDRHTIDPNDIDQDGYGSCSVLSTLHTIASQDPSVIQDMIRDNGDGTYTVTFQEEKEILGVTVWVPVEVTVSGPFSAGGGANPGDTSAQGSEVWPAIIEKAYVQHFHPEFANDKTIWPGNRGVNPADVMQHILGADPTTSSTGDISSTQMTELLANGDAVVAWTPGFKDEKGNWLPNVTDEQKELIEHYGIAGGHAYAVSEVIPAGTPYTDPHTGEQVTCDEDVIVLDNPWGHSDVVMPYSDYQKVYGSVSNTPID